MEEKSFYFFKEVTHLIEFFFLENRLFEVKNESTMILIKTNNKQIKNDNNKIKENQIKKRKNNIKDNNTITKNNIIINLITIIIIDLFCKIKSYILYIFSIFNIHQK